MRLAHEARRIAGQHAYLDELEGTTRKALGGERDEAIGGLRAFATSLDSHFALEEQVQFPALHGLDPSCRSELAALVVDHRKLQQDLTSLIERLENDDSREERAYVRNAFDWLTADLRRHEEREEALLDRAQTTG
jgi:hemerythrin-like domain-containing protein